MFQINCLNPISKVGLDRLTADYKVIDNMNDAEGVLVRSASMHEMDLPENLLAVARAGAGVNNIPLDKCAEKGIVVFNTPGANANGVKELVIAGMLLAARDVVGGIEWVKASKDNADIAKAAEKEKKKFAGTEVMGKKLGVIGLGAIGVKVANTAVSLGMEVYGYDPYVSVNAAWNLSRSVKHVMNVEEIYADCDYITIHVPLLDSTKGMINKEAISKMKDGVVLLNFARDLLANEADVLEALKSGKVARYVSDFPNPTTAGQPGCIVIPHLGASTEESEDNCAVMAARQLDAYLRTGNIRNSVNYPSVEIPMGDGTRICALHANIPAVIANISGVLSGYGINIENLTNKSKGDNAYTLVETTGILAADVAAAITEKIGALEGMHRVRII